jgi:hypothetical protein
MGGCLHLLDVLWIKCLFTDNFPRIGNTYNFSICNSSRTLFGVFFNNSQYANFHVCISKYSKALRKPTPIGAKDTDSISHWRSLVINLRWFILRRSVGLSLLLSGTPLSPWPNFTFSFLLPDIALLFVLGLPLRREDGSVICSIICQWSESQRTHNHTLLSHLKLLGSLSIASYDSQGLRWKYSYPPPHGDSPTRGRICNL